MHIPNSGIDRADIRLAGTEAEDALIKRDCLLYQPDAELALANVGV